MIIDLSRDKLLSEFSIKTLQDRYLIEGETSPQQAFARAAKAFASNDAHAQRLYDYASQLWFMFATPLLSNGGSTRGLPISCFTGDTYISTVSGGKFIKDINVGQKVLTHKGRPRKVTAIRKSLSSDVYELVVNNRGTRLKVTGNHQLLTDKGWERVDFLRDTSYPRKAQSRVGILNGLEIEEKEHTIHISNPQGNTSNSGQFKRTLLNTEVPVTQTLAWALGFWFAEGSTNTNGTLRVTHKTTENLSRWLEIMEQSFGLLGNVHSERNWNNADIYSKTLTEYFDKEFGKGALSKTLPDWIVKLPYEHLLSFYQGLYAGDGWKTSVLKTIQLSNPELVMGISNILNKIGIPHTLRLDVPTNSGVLSGKITERTASLRTSKNLEEYEHLLFNKITSLTKLEGEFEVYDIEVEEDHSFVAAGVIAHNCFLNFVPDSRGGITDHYTENAWLSSVGGGVGGYWGALRPVGAKTSHGSESTGVIPFLKVVDAEMLAFSQGVTRRGSYAAYLDMSHPEIEEFLDVRKPTGGDINRKSTNLHHGVVIPDSFMKLIENATLNPGFDDSWDLIDPNTKKVVKTVPAKALWVKLIQNRVETGEPYIMWGDTVNAALPWFQKEKGLRVHQSNLCAEIVLPTDELRTAVCCLSSVNLEEFDSWSRVPQFIPDLVEMLDNVLQIFIDTAPPALHKAVFSASQERSIGLGALGFHAYLQRHNIPFESVMAKAFNNKAFSLIKTQASQATRRLAKERGGCPDDPTGEVRNAHLLAIAPNASSSIICGNTSPSIEPYRANAFLQKTKSGSSLLKNEYLEHLLDDLGENTDEVWKSIMTNGGSVQHLDFLDDYTKDVFKTGPEIGQQWLVEFAADRQKHICQSQSLNLFFPADVSKQELHDVHLIAWKKKVKTLYYLRSEAIKRADNVSAEALRQYIFKFADDEDCLSCQG